MGSGRFTVHLPLRLWATAWAVEDAWCIFHCHCGRQHGQWKMHGASSTATVGDSMSSGRCMVHLPLPWRAKTWTVEDARCSFHCDYGRQYGQWKMHGAPSTATAGDNMGSGICTVRLPLRLWATAFAMGDAWCIFHCHCERQHWQWTMHSASSTATMGDSMGSGRCMVHLPLQLRATTWAVEDAWCIFHCDYGRQHGQWNMHCASFTATAGDNMGSGRCTVHRSLPMVSPTAAVEDAPCIFHCPCCRP